MHLGMRLDYIIIVKLQVQQNLKLTSLSSLIDTLFVNLTASKGGIEASLTPPALVGYLVILLMVGFNYNL